MPDAFEEKPLKALDTEDALARIAGDADFYRKLLRVYMTDASARLQDLSEAVLAEDFKAAGEYAHAIKGMSATVSASAVAKAAQELEQAATKSDGRNLPPLLARLSELLEHTLGEARTFTGDS